MRTGHQHLRNIEHADNDVFKPEERNHDKHRPVEKQDAVGNDNRRSDGKRQVDRSPLSASSISVPSRPSLHKPSAG